MLLRLPSLLLPPVLLLQPAPGPSPLLPLSLLPLLLPPPPPLMLLLLPCLITLGRE